MKYDNEELSIMIMGYSLGGVMFVLLVYDIVMFGVNCYGVDVDFGIFG